MSSGVAIQELDGLKLSLAPCPKRGPGVIVASLEGDGFLSRVREDCEPAFPQMGRLPEFLATAAAIGIGKKAAGTALGEDFRLEAEGVDDGFVKLYVCMGSTSDDACNWVVHADLQLFRERLRQFAEEAATVFV